MAKLSSKKKQSWTVIKKSIAIPFLFENTEHLPEGERALNQIEINPITVGAWFKIQPLIQQIPEEELGKIIIVPTVEANSDTHSIIEKHRELLIDVICIGVYNKVTESPTWFKAALSDNVAWDDIHLLFNAIMYRTGLLSFHDNILVLDTVDFSEEEKKDAAVIEKLQQAIKNDEALLSALESLNK